jgi:hypothetical protein
MIIKSTEIWNKKKTWSFALKISYDGIYKINKKDFTNTYVFQIVYFAYFVNEMHEIGKTSKGKSNFVGSSHQSEEISKQARLRGLNIQRQYRYCTLLFTRKKDSKIPYL